MKPTTDGEMKVMENTGYRMRVRSDSGGMTLIAQRCYRDSGVGSNGKAYWKDMVWYVFGWCDGRRCSVPGFRPEMRSKSEVVDAIRNHPGYRIAAAELGGGRK